MELRPPSLIASWHAHVYFDAGSRDAAWALREAINIALAGRMEMGRFHERAAKSPLGVRRDLERWWRRSTPRWRR